MIQLRPGIRATSLLEAIAEALREANNVLGGGGRVISEYQEWATRHARVLASYITPSSVDSLITTQRYWSLLSVNTSAVGGQVLVGIVTLEVQERIADFEAAADSIRRRSQSWAINQFGMAGAAQQAIVLDTNTLLRHSGDLASVPWHGAVDAFPHEGVALAIPIIVVEELDRLKNSNNAMYVNGDKLQARALARTALKMLDREFTGQSTFTTLETIGSGVESVNLYATLLIDESDHIRLHSADLEIIDRALELQAYAKNVALATYDQAMLFRARKSGLTAFSPIHDDL
ncbi:PIN domain-containing protein [Subtercola endophyticus]|uniref:PIN domain-containing protein n=1 Tax=Subtercola endophyticus TaxID=2895559 RepID=UPI001E33582E|nr:PIN domain-containing protein [Subtercola endophyticus]UFS58710.1 PIN domain-containing protein [Subtercola endophyticus]